MPDADLTHLLQRVRDGAGSLDDVVPHVYDELRRIARAQRRRTGARATLATTDLVHEAYLRLVDPARAGFNDRAHFFAVAARAMRHILIDYARRQGAQKRGGDRAPLPLDEAPALATPDAAAAPRAAALLDLDRALTHLATLDARLARVVEMKFFGGMTEEEIGAVLTVSARTVQRDWRKAKRFLADALDA